jgi:hypothetical protein
MKPLHLLCAASLLVNAALAFFILRPASAGTTFPKETRHRFVEPQSISTSANPVSPEFAAHWAALHSDDITQYTGNLRAAGLSDSLVRRIIAAEIDEQFRAREEALRPPRKQLKYWQTDNSRPSMETQLALLDLRREKARLRSQILGPEPTSATSDSDNPLAPAKREMLKLISEDYDTMINAIRGQGSMLLAAEKDKIKYLEAEKTRELAELLTPDELAEHEKRNSPITQQLRWQLKDFDASDAEFDLIYAAEKAYKERTEQNKNSLTHESWKNQQEAFDEAASKLKAQLGEVRYADYARARDNEYQQLSQLVQRSGLPNSVAANVFDLRDSSCKKSVEIFDSKTLSLEEKKAALETLATNTRAQIKSALGAEAAEAYFTTSNRWLNTIAKGKITFSNYGRSSSSSSLSSQPRNPPGK